MAKFDNGIGLRFLLSDRMFLYLSFDTFYMYHRIHVKYPFLLFYLETKKFEEGMGFGESEKEDNPNWFKSPNWKWKEMSK